MSTGPGNWAGRQEGVQKKFLLMLEREEGREKERETSSAASCGPPTEVQGWNFGMFPDQESHTQPLCTWDDL